MAWPAAVLVALQQHLGPADVEDVASDGGRERSDLHERVHGERENRVIDEFKQRVGVILSER